VPIRHVVTSRSVTRIIREPLTQGSRGAIKARRYFSIRYANHSAGGVAPPGLLKRGGRSRRPSRTSKALDHAKRCRSQGAPPGDTRVRHCGWPAVTTRVACERAVRERSGAHATSRSASSMARPRERRQAARITHRLLGGALRGFCSDQRAVRACDALQALPRRRWRASRQRP